LAPGTFNSILEQAGLKRNQRRTTMLTAAAVLISYSIALVVAGHGAVPMAALLVIGGTDSWWVAGKIIGWMGVASLVVATWLLRSDATRRLIFQFLASIVLYLSWWMVAYKGNGESGSLWSSFVLSVPLHITFLVLAYRAVFYKRARVPSLGVALDNGDHDH